MADQLDVSALPPPLPDEESPFYGRSVDKGYFRFLSVSQVVKFDVRQEGGCPRAWAYDKLFGKKEIIEPDDPRNRGKRYAREGELYLKYNYDALSPVMRAGKHLLPKPGPDLEVEEPLAGTKERTLEAIALRDRVIAGERIPDEEIDKIARLTACGIPFIGAADYAHHRGVYVAAGGVLVDEPYPDVTSECGDHKTTSRINDHTTRPRKKGAQPMVLMGYAKTPEKIGAHPQMLGYGVWQHNKHPYLRYVRLSHNYYQTKNGYSAEKRTILVTVDEIRERWRGTVVPVVREMIDVARAVKPEDVPFNLKSCRSFGRDCHHSEYCDRPARDFFEVVDSVFNEKGSDMTLDLNALFPGAVTGDQLPPSLPTVQTQPQQSEEERARQIAEEKVRLLSLIGAVNPADAPPVNPLTQADALSPEAIAEIENPELKAQVEAHAKAVAEREAAEKAARVAEKPKTGCAGVGQTLLMTDKEKFTRKKKCPGCNKELKITDKDITQDCLFFVVPKHKMAEVSVQQVPPLPVSSAPSLPQSATSTPADLVCGACGLILTSNNSSRLQTGEVKHFGCSAVQQQTELPSQLPSAAGPPPLPATNGTNGHMVAPEGITIGLKLTTTGDPQRAAVAEIARAIIAALEPLAGAK